MAKLITDNAPLDAFELLSESIEPGKPKTYILKGIYAQSCTKNGNGRSYPYEMLKEQIDEFDREFI